MLWPRTGGELLHVHHWIDSGVNFYSEALSDPLKQRSILLATLAIVNDILRGSRSRRRTNRQHGLGRIRILRSRHANTLQELERSLLNALELFGEELEGFLRISHAVRVAHVCVETSRVRTLRGFEGVCEVAELGLAYGDAGTVVADVDLDKDWDLPGPGFFGDAFKKAYVVWVVYEEGNAV
jgi:hypothetical protein